MKTIFYILLVFSVLLVGVTPGWAGTATLSWNPPTTSADGTPLTDLAGYKIHYGTTSANYTQVVDVGLTSTPNAPQDTLNTLVDGQTYYFVVTAYDTSGNESGFSNEVSQLIGTTTGSGSGSGGGGGCGMVRNISGRSGPGPGQVTLNLALLAFLLSLGKMQAMLKRRKVLMLKPIAFLISIGLSFIFSLSATAQTITLNPWDNKTAPGWIYNTTFSGGNPTPDIDGTTNTPDGPNALRFIYGSGYVSGSGAEGSAQYDFPDQQDLWYGHWFKYSPNFEWHPINNKISIILFSPVGNFVIGVYGSSQGSNALKIVLTNQITWGPGSQNFFSNTGYNPTIQAGQWYWLEVHVTMNTPGVSNGVAEVWLNNQKVMRHTNVPYRPSSAPNQGFTHLNHSPIWGGGGATKSQTDYLWVDYTVISTQPIGMPGGPPPDAIPPTSPQGLNVQ